MSRSLLRGKIKLVAICGKARSGKDTLAQALCMEFGYRQYSFAEPLYRMLRCLPYLEHLTSSISGEQKEAVNHFYGKSPRRMLQTLGTEWGRNLVNAEMWVNLMQDTLERKHDLLRQTAFVISDCRFENEALWVQALGGICVKVVRDITVDVLPHISEAGIPAGLINLTIENFDTIEAFRATAPNVNVLAEERRTASLARP